jgi:hypothetical protein
VREEVRCPLCGYELRGLVDPRCPECGHEFTWAEVLDPERQVHRYLFEHHPERNVWSFWRTAWGGWRPGRFWRELRPAQPSRGRRLVGYWVVTVAFVLLGIGGMFGLVLVDAAKQRASERAWALAYYSPGSAGQPQIALLRSRFGSVQGYIDTVMPTPSHAAFYWQEAIVFWRNTCVEAPFTPMVLGAYVAWPWATIGGLMVFQVSMRRARIRPIHAVRCVLYSFDGGIWIGLGMVLVLSVIAWPGLQGVKPGLAMFWIYWVPWAAVGLLAFSVARLGVAYRRYVRMDHAWAVIVSSQLMVGLVAAWALLSWDTAMRQLIWIFR